MNHLFQNKEKAMRKERRNFLVPVIPGMVLSMSSLSAQGMLHWTPVNTTVPLSPASLALLAVMFLTAGSYLLYRSQNKAFRSILSVLLMAGMFGVVKEAQAIADPPIIISTPSGSLQLNSLYNTIKNDEDNIAVKLNIVPDPNCGISFINCDELLPGEECQINFTCSDPD
jgi:hypothetical protein